MKAALALYRAGRRSEFEQVTAELADRYSDEKVTLGGQTGSAGELLRRLHRRRERAADRGRAVVTPARPGPDLAWRTVDPAWQLRFADSVEAGMTPLELTQWESNRSSAAVPAATVDGTTLFVNYLGISSPSTCTSGKMLWRSASFHNLELLTHAEHGPQRSTRAGSRSSPRASTSGLWPAT